MGMSRIGKERYLVLELFWSPETARKAKRLRLTLQRKPVVEAAAVALGLVLAHQVADLGQLDVTAYGDCADFRSLERMSVLEVSGTESRAELGRRHREKVAQALANPFGWDAYVAVCSFSDQGHRILFSKHTPPEA